LLGATQAGKGAFGEMVLQVVGWAMGGSQDGERGQAAQATEADKSHGIEIGGQRRCRAILREQLAQAEPKNPKAVRVRDSPALFVTPPVTVV